MKHVLLFPKGAQVWLHRWPEPPPPSLFEMSVPKPLAEQLRPARLEDVIGQEHVLSMEKPLGRLLASGRAPSVILYGPAGSGKTTLARLMATRSSLRFVKMSA